MAPSAPIRPARPGDSEHITRLQSLLAEPATELLSTALAERETAASVRLSRLLVSPDTTDQPVGYLLAVDGETTHIAELAVDPEYRRQQRATALLGAICETAAEPVTVCVAVTNEPARSLYEQAGFIEVTRTPAQFKQSDGLTLRYDPDSDSDSDSDQSEP